VKPPIRQGEKNTFWAEAVCFFGRIRKIRLENSSEPASQAIFLSGFFSDGLALANKERQNTGPCRASARLFSLPTPMTDSSPQSSFSRAKPATTAPAHGEGIGWMSLQGRWAQLMASGEKTVEWRKSAPARLDGGLFVLWESAPGAQALAIARAPKIWRAPWQDLFERFGDRGMATREELAAYYGDKPQALAIEVEIVERFERPIPWRLIKPRAGGFSPGPAPRWLESEQARVVEAALREAQRAHAQEATPENVAEDAARQKALAEKRKNRGPWRA